MRQRPIDRLRAPFQGFLHDQSAGAVLLVVMTALALFWANSPWRDSYHHLWEHTLAISIDEWRLERTLHHWINDGLMAMFFFLVGLELKREVVGGHLARPRDALLPVAAGLAGMVVPALLYLAFNRQGPAHAGWGIPMATDIAFAMGLMALLGDRVPVALKVFITTLAIADDLGAVLVIALFYTSSISIDNLAIGAGFLFLLIGGNRLGVRTPWFYALVGIGGLWTAFLLSGIHATVAGVLAAFTIPAVTELDERTYIDRILRHVRDFARLKPNDQPTLTAEQLEVIAKIDQASEFAETPLQRLEHKLQPLVMFFVMPLFAFANAGVELPLDPVSSISSAVSLGTMSGLVVGKPLGILLVCWLLVRMRWAVLPVSVSWGHMIGGAFLAGIGFTMSLFVGQLAFQDPALIDQAKLGVLLGSLLAGAIGFVLLRAASKAG